MFYANTQLTIINAVIYVRCESYICQNIHIYNSVLGHSLASIFRILSLEMSNRQNFELMPPLSSTSTGLIHTIMYVKLPRSCLHVTVYLSLNSQTRPCCYHISLMIPHQHWEKSVNTYANWCLTVCTEYVPHSVSHHLNSAN